MGLYRRPPVMSPVNHPGRPAAMAVLPAAMTVAVVPAPGVALGLNMGRLAGGVQSVPLRLGQGRQRQGGAA